MLLTTLLLLGAAPADPVAAFNNVVGDRTAAKHPVRLLWKGEAYGVSGTLEDELSAAAWRGHLLLPEIPLEDTSVVEGDQVSDLDRNGHAKHVKGTERDVNLTLHAV